MLAMLSLRFQPSTGAGKLSRSDVSSSRSPHNRVDSGIDCGGLIVEKSFAIL